MTSSRMRTWLERLRLGARQEEAVAGPTGSRPGDPSLGPYKLLSQIGRGSMATVWLAESCDGSRVALKAFPLEAADEEDPAPVRELFLAEASAARRLEHPGLVTVFDVGESGGLAWIAMEHVDGGDLGRHARGAGSLAWEPLLSLLAPVAEGLHHAHRRGVVHRDIKPGNLLMDRAETQVKLADFGMARLQDAARTRTGLLLGTPAYMAPEQLAGAPVDARSDVYAFGVTLFELLTGALPYDGGSLGALMHRVASEPVPDIRRWRPELPAALADLVALAMEKQPSLRYPNAAELALDLRALAGASHDRRVAAPPDRDAAA